MRLVFPALLAENYPELQEPKTLRYLSSREGGHYVATGPVAWSLVPNQKHNTAIPLSDTIEVSL